MCKSLQIYIILYISLYNYYTCLCKYIIRHDNIWYFSNILQRERERERASERQTEKKVRGMMFSTFTGDKLLSFSRMNPKMPRLLSFAKTARRQGTHRSQVDWLRRCWWSPQQRLTWQDTQNGTAVSTTLESLEAGAEPGWCPKYSNAWQLRPVASDIHTDRDQTPSNARVQSRIVAQDKELLVRLKGKYGKMHACNAMCCWRTSSLVVTLSGCSKDV